MTAIKPMLKITCSPECAELISCLLLEAGAVGLEERDCTTMSYSAQDKTEIIAGFDNVENRTSAEQSIINIAATMPKIEIENIDDLNEDWKTKWKEFFQPQVFSKLQIITPWMLPPREDLISIVIDPGLAFGTGGHATTRLIIKMLELRAEANKLPNKAADIGSGSGILAVAAKKLGVSYVIGVDIEEEAVNAFYENAERNNVLDGLECKLGTAADLDETYDLVMANIQIDVFRIATTDIASLISPKGEVLISGILNDQIEECLELWSGFELTERCDEGEWSALALRRV